MALRKEKQTKFGVTAGYWKVDMVTIDRRMKEASFNLNLYLDKDSEQFLESMPIVDLMGREDKTLYERYFESGEYTDIYNACYMFTKENVEYFKDAADV